MEAPFVCFPFLKKRGGRESYPNKREKLFEYFMAFRLEFFEMEILINFLPG
jgi:hypothetical protein